MIMAVLRGTMKQGSGIVLLTDLFSFQLTKEVRLFDRSELNTYRDELAFSKLCSQHLTSHLRGAPKSPDYGWLQDAAAGTAARLDSHLSNAAGNSWPFLHTTLWKDSLAELHRLANLLASLSHLPQPESCTIPLQALQAACSSLQAAAGNLPANHHLHYISELIKNILRLLSNEHTK